MTDFELYRTIRERLETVWQDAERRRRWFGFEMSRDSEVEISRQTGGRV